MIDVNQEKWEAGGVQDYQHQYPHRPSSSYKKLLDRVAFWIVYIAWRVWYKVFAHNATSVGVGRGNRLFCVCVAETVLLLLLINIIVYIVVVVVCQNRQVNGEKYLMFNAFGERYLSLLKIFVFKYL